MRVRRGYSTAVTTESIDAFGPYLPRVRDRLDYSQASCPNSDLICTQSIWLEHSLLLGTADDMDEIAAAFEKIHCHRDELGGR